MTRYSSKNILFVIVTIFIVVISIFGITFAVLNYARTSKNDIKVVAGNLKIKYDDINASIDLVDASPISDIDALNSIKEGSYYDFSVIYDVSTSAELKYNVYIEDLTESLEEVTSGSLSHLTSDLVKIAVYDFNNYNYILEPTYLSNIPLVDDVLSLYIKNVTSKSTDKYRLYLWIPTEDANGVIITNSRIVESTIALTVNVKASASLTE